MLDDNSKMWQLVKVPALITLVVTFVRLTGELAGGPAILFGAEAGGGFSLVGIVWLVPIFGVYFGKALAQSDDSPGAGKAALFGLLAMIATLLVMVGTEELFSLFMSQLVAQSLGFVVGSMAGCYLVFRGWGRMAHVLLNYAVAARLPVLIIMFFAILGRWGTHYAAAGNLISQANLGFIQKFVVLALVPQMTIWIVYTMAVGLLFSAIGIAIASKPATQ